MEDFIAEAKELVENGVIFNNNLYKCVLKMLCADAPAKAFVLNVKSHSGYSSCTKCIEKGEYQNRRIAFSDKPSQLRTDEDFINKTSKGYHLGTSCLENIPQFGLVSHVPLDYQHLLCLGVVKKLINIWLCDALKVRLPFRKVQIISNALENIIRPHVPVEFQRKPRSLFHFRQWKATEWRQLLLYSGPTILKPVLSAEVFNNFLTLHVAITILCSNSYCLNENYLEYAQNLLQHFVTTFKIIYGSHHVSHNVHGLLHLTDDVKNYGTLDMFSTFKFENYMQQIKKLLRKNEKPLQQIAKRVQEYECIRETIDDNYEKNTQDNDQYILKNKHHNGPIVEKSSNQQYSILLYNKFKLNIYKKADQYCSLKSGDIVFIENFTCCENQKRKLIIGKKFTLKKDLYHLPCSSSVFNIYEVSKLSKRQMWPIEFIDRKYFIYPTKNAQELSYAAFPLLHTEIIERPDF